MPTGKVMRFDASRGFGFIKPDEGGPDLFLHISELARGVDPASVRPGVLVSFEEGDNGRGPKAVNVRLPDGPAPAARTAVVSEQQAAAIWQEASNAGYEEFIRVLHERGWL